MPETGFQIENPMKPASILLLERTASRNLHKSAPGGRGRQNRDPSPLGEGTLRDTCSPAFKVTHYQITGKLLSNIR